MSKLVAHLYQIKFKYVSRFFLPPKDDNSDDEYLREADSCGDLKGLIRTRPVSREFQAAGKSKGSSERVLRFESAISISELPGKLSNNNDDSFTWHIRCPV